MSRASTSNVKCRVSNVGLAALLFAVLLTNPLRGQAELIWSDGSAATPSGTDAYRLFRSSAVAVVATKADEKCARPRRSSSGAFEYTASLLTTCTGLVKNYPQNAVNYFFPEKHSEVYYFAYVLIFPPHSGSHTVRND